MRQFNQTSPMAPRLWDRPAFALAAVAVVLALLIGVCALVYLLPPEATLFDVVRNPASDISDTSLNYVSNLSEDVTIYWLCEGTPTDSVFSSFLMEYADAGNRVSIKLIDTLLLPEFAAEYTSQKLSDSSLIVESARRYYVIDMADMFYYVNEYINYLAGGTTYQMSASEYESWSSLYGEYMAQSATYKYFRGEALLTSALDYVTAEVIPHAYLLKPHGNRAMSDTLKQKMTMAGISLEILDLEARDAVPEDASCIILFSPEEDLTAHEAALLKAHIQKGGSFLLVAGPDTCEFTHLASVCALFGMKSSGGVVVDSNKNNYYGDTHQLIPLINSQHAAMYYLSSQSCRAYMPNSMGIMISDKLPDRVSVSPMLGTSDSGYRASKDSAKTPLCKPSAQYVAVSATLQTTTENGTADNAYFAWFASDDAFEDENSRVVEYGNYYYLAMTASWMTADENFSSKYQTLAAVDLTTPMLENVTDGTATIIGIVTVILLPASLAVIGTMIYVRRRRR
ncbi:MAG: hypothetical protein E7645_04765 [Ruminococcaceae bacterium]|nr:hypothetical protein [Oscillospiraceae bacterium]